MSENSKKPRKKNNRSKKNNFDKYLLYTNSVQSAEYDAELLWKILKKNMGGKSIKTPYLQEDFCGTAALCYEWVKLGVEHRAAGIDLEQKALTWGLKHHGLEIPVAAVKRVRLIKGDVLEDHGIKPHVICALNFSYFFMKDRKTLKKYFTACKKSLAKGGILAIDAFGGPDYLGSHIDRRRNTEKKFQFWWEVEMFDAINHQIKTHIHFQMDGQKRRNRVFSYDWRLWSIPEITDVLLDAGFTNIAYWAEGLDRQGRGDGVFREIKTEKNCSTWITYIVAK